MYFQNEQLLSSKSVYFFMALPISPFPLVDVLPPPSKSTGVKKICASDPVLVDAIPLHSSSSSSPPEKKEEVDNLDILTHSSAASFENLQEAIDCRVALIRETRSASRCQEVELIYCK